jgi:hypothetical protein
MVRDTVSFVSTGLYVNRNMDTGEADTRMHAEPGGSFP